MKFNRKTFWTEFRDRIDSSIEQEQVDGLEFLLDRMELDYPFWKDIRHIAYALATAGHETAWSFQPVEEGYYLGSAARVSNFQKTLRYYPYFGRGLVQLTWESGYKKAGDAFGIDLVNNPELALEPEVSYKILTYGMHQGWFTGKKLQDYIAGFKCDYKGARKIINGTDKAALIAGYAVQFEKILQAALMTEDEEIDSIIDNIGKPKDSAEAPADVPATQAAEDVHAVEPTPTGTDTTGLQPQEQPPTIQQAENIINNAGDNTPVPFVPETLTMEAPAKDGATTTATKATFLGFAIPGSLYLAFETVSQWVKDGVIDIKQILDPLIGLIRDNIRYIPYLVGFIVSVVVVKKIFKQITFLVQMVINANPNWHNVNIVPFVAEEREKRFYQFWK